METKEEIKNTDILSHNIDKRPKKGAWAPGWYTGKCHECRESFIGDKRALICADCAYTNPS